MILFPVSLEFYLQTNRWAQNLQMRKELRCFSSFLLEEVLFRQWSSSSLPACGWSRISVNSAEIRFRRLHPRDKHEQRESLSSTFRGRHAWCIADSKSIAWFNREGKSSASEHIESRVWSHECQATADANTSQFGLSRERKADQTNQFKFRSETSKTRTTLSKSPMT